MRGKRQKKNADLSRERVLEVAVSLLDREGLSGFSMRRLGAELEADPMAVYYYFPNKGALLDGVLERILARVVLPEDVRIAWPEQIRMVMRELRRVLRNHAHVVPLLIARPLWTPASLQIGDMLARLLLEAGFTEDQAADAILSLSSYLVGHLLAEQEPTDRTTISEQEARAHLMQSAIEKYPAFQHVFTRSQGYSIERRFERGLELLLQGLLSQERGRS